MIMGSGKAPALHFELGERVSKRGAGEGGFLGVEMLGKAGLGAASGLLGAGFVNVFGANRHIGHDGDAFASDFDEAFADSQKIVPALFAGDNFAGDDLG